MYYVGMPPSYFYLIDVLSQKICTYVVCVLICLQKIRLNQTFKGLSYDFCVSESFCSMTFTKTVPALAECFSTLILWKAGDTIKSRLPIYFRARFSHVQSIIDCFEIEIEKPSDPIKQTLTWSNYKKCNTLKYLISSTPDGYINYVSSGFDGRTSDIKITDSCGYLDVLPDGAGVMADRGFKGVAPALEKKSCSLIRPPSVSATQKSSKDEVRLSKRIASLRIHIERVIRRVREFSLLKPHACVNKKLVKYVDCIVVIACGLINLQAPIISKHV
ncbi:hypothetical protein RI129_003263 [Pyrocoelia pectoralis]|uniref:DDE Tnp4 domain-containing protein n=1 Tax=Pyrocoelia pectoralis TaxID=417401 RepID=A0AAN7VNM0_9COLE